MKYRLLKDLPDAKAGDIFVPTIDDKYGVIFINDFGYYYMKSVMYKNNIENNTEWFKPIEDEVEKSCKSCGKNCKDCVDFSKWQAKKSEKNCYTCHYETLPDEGYPCRECRKILIPDNMTKWQSKNK